jgi:hypothetical protein
MSSCNCSKECYVFPQVQHLVSKVLVHKILLRTSRGRHLALKTFDCLMRAILMDHGVPNLNWD